MSEPTLAALAERTRPDTDADSRSYLDTNLDTKSETTTDTETAIEVKVRAESTDEPTLSGSAALPPAATIAIAAPYTSVAAPRHRTPDTADAPGRAGPATSPDTPTKPDHDADRSADHDRRPDHSGPDGHQDNDRPEGRTPTRLVGLPRVIQRRFLHRVAPMWRRLRRAARQEDGMSTAEYAVGTVAAVAFSTALYKVVSSDAVKSGLTNIIAKALNATF